MRLQYLKQLLKRLINKPDQALFLGHTYQRRRQRHIPQILLILILQLMLQPLTMTIRWYMLPYATQNNDP